MRYGFNSTLGTVNDRMFNEITEPRGMLTRAPA
jgi:hypothetical protein